MTNKTKTQLFTLILVALLGPCALPAIMGCSSPAPQESEASQTVEGPQTAADGSPYYDPECFTQESGRFAYSHNGFSTARTGIDVSDHQGEIDWTAVAEDGIDFAIIRVGYRGTTEGKIHPDEHFAKNLMEAQAAGIQCGVYFFSQAISVEEAREEADFVLERLAGNELDYPVVFDYENTPESRVALVDDKTAEHIVSSFCSPIRAAGYYPMVYGNAYDLQKLSYGKSGDPALWFAEYGSFPSSSHESELWQYTSEGYVEGIETNVDMNLDLAYNDWEGNDGSDDGSSDNDGGNSHDGGGDAGNEEGGDE